MILKCDFSAFLACFKMSFSSLHNPNYIQCVILKPAQPTHEKKWERARAAD